jgi:hypothetical protein
MNVNEIMRSVKFAHSTYHSKEDLLDPRLTYVIPLYVLISFNKLLH